MSASSDKALYGWLPAAYRVQDAAQRKALRALLAVIEGEFQILEGDIDRLYDNWFIETCDEWVVPYIGDLLGVRSLLPIGDGMFTQRAAVANTLGYRRRKGTAAMLEQLARDVSGWPAKAAEFFPLLATTQFLNHVRPTNEATVSLRHPSQLELIDTPFDTAAHTAEVRHIDNARGKYNIGHVGLFLWRLQSYPLSKVTARPVPVASTPEAGHYTFSPLGIDIPLFNLPRTETAITQLAAETNVPGPLRCRALHDELDARRRGLIGDSSGFFAVDRPVFQVFLAGQPVPLEELAICDLSDPPTPLPEGWQRPPVGAQVGVDPVLGRLALPGGATDGRVEVSYADGFSGDVGGGPYDRRQSLSKVLTPTRKPDWQQGVTRDAPPGHPDLVATLAAAIETWNNHPVGLGVIAVMDSRSYGPPTDPALPEILIPGGSQLVIAAADWPEEELDDLSQRIRRVGRLTPSGRRPHVIGPVSVRGTAPAGHLELGRLVFDGLLIEGGLTVLPGNLGSVRVAHSTLAPTPGSASMTVQSGSPADQRNGGLGVVLERSISGPLTATDAVRAVTITDSVLDAALASGHGIAVTAPATEIQTSTVLGGIQVGTLEAGNSIFTHKVIVERRQTGCVRFCYLLMDSLAPRRFHCQPANPKIAGRVVPRFTSVAYGQPAYGQLATSCPGEIVRGTEDEGEMGAFHFLQQPQRIDNLRASLDEYLRFGLEAGILLAT